MATQTQEPEGVQDSDSGWVFVDHPALKIESRFSGYRAQVA